VLTVADATEGCGCLPVLTVADATEGCGCLPVLAVVEITNGCRGADGAGASGSIGAGARGRGAPLAAESLAGNATLADDMIGSDWACCAGLARPELRRGWLGSAVGSACRSGLGGTPMTGPDEFLLLLAALWLAEIAGGAAGADAAFLGVAALGGGFLSRASNWRLGRRISGAVWWFAALGGTVVEPDWSAVAMAADGCVTLIGWAFSLLLLTRLSFSGQVSCRNGRKTVHPVLTARLSDSNGQGNI
jgi:hypothetical protein